jgi:arginyl-tRNA synthetase
VNSTPRFGGSYSSKISWRCCWRLEVDSAVDDPFGEPSHVARYAFQLAQAYSNFYQKYSILHEPDRERKVFLLWMTDFFRRQLERTGAILGIEIPEYM